MGDIQFPVGMIAVLLNQISHFGQEVFLAVQRSGNLLRAVLLPVGGRVGVASDFAAEVPYFVKWQEVRNIVNTGQKREIFALRDIFQQTVLIDRLVNGIDENLPEVVGFAFQVDVFGQFIKIFGNAGYGVLVVFFLVCKYLSSSSDLYFSAFFRRSLWSFV